MTQSTVVKGLRQANAAAACLAAAASLVLPREVLAQDFPRKPVRLVSQFIAGSGGDIITRVYSGALSELLKQPVVMDNRAGAGGIVAAEIVAKAAPDGYTLLAATPTIPVIRVAAGSKLSFDPTRELAPVTTVGSTPSIVIANPKTPFDSFLAMIEYARKNPNKLSYATSGVGSAHHISAEQIALITGAQLVHVPYKAGQQAILDVVTGVIPLAYVIIGEAIALAKAGKLKILATREGARVRDLPEVPAVGELIKGFEPLPGWTGIFTPAGVPPAVFQRLVTDSIKALKAPDSIARLNAAGFEVGAAAPEEFADQIKRQIALISKVTKAASIKLE